MAHAVSQCAVAAARLQVEKSEIINEAAGIGQWPLPVSSHFDVVVSAARVELQLAGHQFHQLRNRRSHQRLRRAIASWSSVSGARR